MSLYLRNGSPKEQNGTTDKGAPVYRHVSSCYRCGGAGGSEAWRHTGWTCYQCGGSGKGPVVTDKLYTAEKLAKLNATAAAKLAKKDAAAAAARAIVEAAAQVWINANAPAINALREALPLTAAGSYPANAISRVLNGLTTANDRSLDWALAQAVVVFARIDDSAKSEWIGTEGQRIEVAFTVRKTLSFEPTAWGRPPFYIIIGSTEFGEHVVYKGSHGIAEGSVVNGKWTVKKHELRDGVKQTILARPHNLTTVEKELA